METSVAAATASLAAFREKVQQTIDHIASGVDALNEDQVSTAVTMLNSLESEFESVKTEVLEAIAPTVKPAEPEVKTEVEKLVATIEADAAAVEAKV